MDINIWTKLSSNSRWNTAVVIDSERTALVLISLTTDGNICIERTYYDMICEINATEYQITFHNTENIAE